MREQDLKIGRVPVFLIMLYVKTAQCKRLYSTGDRFKVVRVLPFKDLFFKKNKNRLSTNYIQSIMLGVGEK